MCRVLQDDGDGDDEEKLQTRAMRRNFLVESVAKRRSIHPIFDDVDSAAEKDTLGARWSF